MSCAECEDCAIQKAEPKEIVYETHITVTNTNFDRFSQACAEMHDTRPLKMTMPTPDGGEVIDFMTQRAYKGGSYLEVLRLLYSNAAWLISHYEIHPIRLKIETVPWHPEVANIMNNPMQYLEAHISIPLEGYKNELRDLLRELKLPVSYSHTSTSGNVLATYRDRLPLKEFENKLKWRLEAIKEERFKIAKCITEFAIYDTNPFHDDAWIHV